MSYSTDLWHPSRRPPLSKLVVYDYETVELTDAGPVASTEAYRANFRVASAAFAYADGRPSEFIQGEDAVGARLQQLQDGGYYFIGHNLQFEYLVTACRYPHLHLQNYADTMRLAQNYDNGGGDDAFEYIILEENLLEPGDMPNIKRKSISGLGLVVCAKRILGADSSHKDEAYKWLNEHEPKSKGKEGRYLHLLPDDIMARYNIADVETTLRLYNHITEFFQTINFDWTLDHQLFMSTVVHIVHAKRDGIEVDRELLVTNMKIVSDEVRTIEQQFKDKYCAYTERLEYQRAVNWILGVKTVKGQRKRYQQWLEGTNKPMLKAIRFNTGSNKQLAELFVNQLGMTPQFFTEKGAPSFKSAMLSQWGEGGEMLKTRRKRMLVLSQMESLLELSEYDGKWHPDLRVSGASTGRLAAGRGQT